MTQQEKPHPFVIGSSITVLFFLLLFVYGLIAEQSLAEATNLILDTRGLVFVILFLTTFFAAASQG